MDLSQIAKQTVLIHCKAQKRERGELGGLGDMRTEGAWSSKEEKREHHRPTRPDAGGKRYLECKGGPGRCVIQVGSAGMAKWPRNRRKHVCAEVSLNQQGPP